MGSDIDLYGYGAMPELTNNARRYKGALISREEMTSKAESPKRMFVLTEDLIRRGYSNNEIEGFSGGNFKRVLSQIGAVVTVRAPRPVMNMRTIFGLNPCCSL